MKQELKTVYIPIKVEDELPEIGKMVFTLNTMIPGKVKYPPKDDGKNISINNRVSEIPNKCEQWYDEYNFQMMYSKVNSWLKPTELITFTPEEYNKHIQDVIKDALETVANKAVTEFQSTWKQEVRGVKPDINKESITNTFEETFNKYKL
jgi:hypothetical protein